jgi:hypothetical protein
VTGAARAAGAFVAGARYRLAGEQLERTTTPRPERMNSPGYRGN